MDWGRGAYILGSKTDLTFLTLDLLSLACFITCIQWIPQIHLWCHPWWPFDGQYGSEAFLIHVVTHVYRHWWHWDRVCGTAYVDALPNEPCQLGFLCVVQMFLGLCTLPSRVTKLFTECNEDFSSHNEETSDFHENWKELPMNSTIRRSSPWIHHTALELRGLSHTGKYTAYGGGGYVKDLIGTVKHAKG